MSKLIIDEHIQRLPLEDRALVKAMIDYGRAFMSGSPVRELWPLHRVWEREMRRRRPERHPEGVLTMPRARR
jgi:hypothetical protein